MRTAIQTTTLPRENIYWLEEWIKYHLWLGFDHIYIYDNTGSVAYEYAPLRGKPVIELDGRNYKGHDIRAMTGHLTNEDISGIVAELGRKYRGRLTILPWLPVNEEGRPFYGQTMAMRHFVATFGAAIEWTLFIDLDEYLVNRDWREWLSYYEGLGFNEVRVDARLFRERIHDAIPTIPTLAITESFPHHPDRMPKRFARTADVIEPAVHGGGRWRKYRPSEETRLVMHHYRVERAQETTAMVRDDTLASRISELKLVDSIPVPLRPGRTG